MAILTILLLSVIFTTILCLVAVMLVVIFPVPVAILLLCAIVVGLFTYHFRH